MKKSKFIKNERIEIEKLNKKLKNIVSNLLEKLGRNTLSKKTIKSLKKDIQGFCSGIVFSVQACINAVTNPVIRQTYSSHIKLIFAVVFLTILISSGVYMWINFLGHISSFLIGKVNVGNINALSSQFVAITPFISNIVLKYAGSNVFERIFFVTLSVRDRKYADELKKKSNRWIWRLLFRYLKYFFFISLFIITCILFPWSIPLSIPIIGVFLTGHKIRNTNWKLFCLITLLYFIPSTREYSLVIAKLFMQIRMLLRELLDPYLSRSQNKSFSSLCKEKEGFLIGFAVPFLAAMHIPYISPILWVLGYSATGALAGELHAQERKLN